MVAAAYRRRNRAQHRPLPAAPCLAATTDSGDRKRLPLSNGGTALRRNDGQTGTPDLFEVFVRRIEEDKASSGPETPARRRDQLDVTTR